jgi:hypothetical protein
MQPTNISYKYIIAAACFGTQAVGIGLFISYGVFINPLIEEFGWPRAAISGASSLSFFLMGLLGIFVGRLNQNRPQEGDACHQLFYRVRFFSDFQNPIYLAIISVLRNFSWDRYEFH